tara:strand:- start:202533 stop:202751 length:219 start_codon:yes stop_codon:yes gene_type:complete
MLRGKDRQFLASLFVFETKRSIIFGSKPSISNRDGLAVRAEPVKARQVERIDTIESTDIAGRHFVALSPWNA